MTRVLITGPTGTVGEASAKYLADKGYEVVGVSRSVRPQEYFAETANLDLLDTEDVEKLEELMMDCDAVFHLAWNLSEENIDTGTKWKGNIEIFENVLQAAKDTEVRIFINGSSIHAGTGDIKAYTVEASLEDTPEPYRSSIDPENSFDLRKDRPEKLLSPLEDNPDSPYGESKVETEHRLREEVDNGFFDLGVSIRIGGVNEEDKSELEGEPYYSSLYWSHRDLGRTIEQIIESDLQKKNGYHQFYGVSDNEGRIFSIENQFIGES